jgi:hypothetical protein
MEETGPALAFLLLGKLWFWRPFFKIFSKMSNYLQIKVNTCFCFSAPQNHFGAPFSRKSTGHLPSLPIWKRRAWEERDHLGSSSLLRTNVNNLQGCTQKSYRCWSEGELVLRLLFNLSKYIRKNEMWLCDMCKQSRKKVVCQKAV